MSETEREAFARVLRTADHCHGIVTRDGEQDACDKPAVAIIDGRGTDAGCYWPACAYHANRYGGGHVVPLAQVKGSARAEAWEEAECDRPHAGAACVPLGGCVGAHFTARLAEADARIDSLTIAVKAMGKRADDAEAALEAGDACGAVGCRALGERDALLAREARVRALADEWQRELDDGRITTPDARYCWGVAASELRRALEGGQP